MQRWSDVRSGERFRRTLLIFVLVATVVFTAAIGLHVHSGREQALQNVRVQAANLALVIEAHASVALEHADHVLTGISYALAYGNIDQQEELVALLQRWEKTSAMVEVVFILDAQGQLLAASDIGVAAGHAGQSYFESHRSGKAKKDYLGLYPLKDADGRPMLSYSRAVTDPAGQLQAVRVIVFRPALFTQLYNKLQLGEEAAISLVRKDSILLLREPHHAMVGSSIADSILIRDELPRSAHGTFVGKAITDNRERQYAYRSLDEQDLVVAVGISTAAAISQWQEESIKLAAQGAVVLLVLVGSVFLLLNSQVRSEYLARSVGRRYQQLFDESPDGMMVVSDTGIVQQHNPAAARMLAQDAQTTATINIHDFLDGSDEGSRSLLRSLELRTNFAGLIRFRHPGGQCVDCELSATRQENDHIHWQWLWIFRDVTERRQAAEAMETHRLQLQALATELATAESRERQALAHELHDGLCQPLAIAALRLTRLKETPEGQSDTDGLTEVAKLIDEADRQARTLLGHISPPMLHRLGLVSALAWLAKDMHEAFGLSVNFADDGHPKPLDHARREVAYRAVRELLINVKKHAGTRAAEVYCERDGDHLNIIVSDEGGGFDPAALQRPGEPSADRSGFGLFAIRERFEYFGGSLRIDTRHSGGTVAHLMMPLSQATAEGVL